MTDSDTPPAITDEHRALSDLYVEALRLEEPARTEQIATVAEMAGDVSLDFLVEIRELDEELQESDRVQNVAADYVARARALARESRRPELETPKTTQSIDFDKIDWIDEEGTHDVEANEVEHAGVRYKLVNLLGRHGLTSKLFKELEKQSRGGESNLGQKLLEQVEDEIIPKIDNGIRTGSKLRPVTSGAKTKAKPSKSLKTRYPGYKEDAQGTNNRVIILKVDEPGSEIPAYAVVALYDHDDDNAVHNALFRSTK